MINLLKKLLLRLPEGAIKNQLKFSFFNHFRDNDFKIFYRHKKFLIKFGNHSLLFHENPYIELAVYNKGYLRKYQIVERNIVVDAGAYDGSFTLFAAKMVGEEGKVIAFEPDEKNYRKLLENIELNSLTNVIPIKKGLWNENTILKFDHEKLGSSALDPQGKVSVSVVKLDDELEKLNIPQVDFLKMDIEGAELEAIKGCPRTLRNKDIKLAIASYHIVNGEKTCFRLEKMLQEIGFLTETSYPEHLTTYAHLE